MRYNNKIGESIFLKKASPRDTNVISRERFRGCGGGNRTPHPLHNEEMC
jgi:hypothetical protein